MSLLVVGNATLDLTMRTERAPVAGETVVATQPQRGPGGKGFNQAVAATLCGAAVHLLAHRGDDEAGAYLEAEAARFGLAGALKVVEGPTDTSIIIVAREGENLIVSTADAARKMTAAAAADAVADLQPATLLMQGNLSSNTTFAALSAARGIGATTIANPSPITFDWSAALPLLDIVVVNALEATMLTGASSPAAAATALRGMGPGRAIVTLGARGALVAGEDGMAEIGGTPVTAHDTTGAGDMFCGALAALVPQSPLTPAIEAAMALAALTVTRPGAAIAFPSPAEAAAIIARHLPDAATSRRGAV